MDLGSIIAIFVFSIIGMALFVYGKRQRLLVPALAGVALMLISYVVRDALLLTAVGTAITAAGVGLRYSIE